MTHPKNNIRVVARRGHLQGVPTTTTSTFYIGTPGKRPLLPLITFAKIHKQTNADKYASYFGKGYRGSPTYSSSTSPLVLRARTAKTDEDWGVGRCRGGQHACTLNSSG
jgi:hypothetical protein